MDKYIVIRERRPGPPDFYALETEINEEAAKGYRFLALHSVLDEEGWPIATVIMELRSE